MASIVECHFRENSASGSGGAIYVSVKSELKAYHSHFTQNRAKEGGSVAVFTANSVIESCKLTSDTASLEGGCISLNAANMTVKHSQFPGCRSLNPIIITASSIENIVSLEFGSALHIHANSDLLVKDSVLTAGLVSRIKAVTCSDSSMHLDSVFISNYSLGRWSGCVYSRGCNLTMDNITFTDTDSAIDAYESTINIYNTVTMNNMNRFLWAVNSHVIFWALTIRGTYIGLQESVVEFRHTLYIRQNEICQIYSGGGNTIKLQSVYVAGPTKEHEMNLQWCKEMCQVGLSSVSSKL